MSKVKEIKIDGPIVLGFPVSSTINLIRNKKTVHVRWSSGSVDSDPCVSAFFVGVLKNNGMSDALKGWLERWSSTFCAKARAGYSLRRGGFSYISPESVHELIDIITRHYSDGMVALATKDFSCH